MLVVAYPVLSFMRFNLPRRSERLLTPIGILLLAFAVFGWGVQYKLSLYDLAPTVSPSIPQAKLLSKNQWAPSPHDAHALDLEPSSQPSTERFFLLGIFFMVALGTQALPATTEKHREGSKPWLSWSSASLSAFFFRPPPSALL